MRQDFDWHSEAREGSQITLPHLCQEHNIDNSAMTARGEMSALSVKCEWKLGCVCLYHGAASVVGGVRISLKELCLHMERACLNKNPYPCFTSCRFVLEQRHGSAFLLQQKCVRGSDSLFLHLHFWLYMKVCMFKIGLLAYLLGSVFICKVFCWRVLTLSHEMTNKMKESFRSIDMRSSV